MMDQLKIDPEFRDKIPPLTEAEYEQLRENIISAGEVYEPIVIWNGTIVDGHNRWKIVQENPSISYRVRPMDFQDKWAAFEWMYRNQLGRRNLTEQQRDLLIGQMYEAAKKAHGGDRRSTNISSAQTGHMKTVRTAERVAAELGIGHNTVKRAGDFSKGIDAMQSQGAEGKKAAEKILAGQAHVTKSTVRQFAKMVPEQQEEIVRNIIDGKPADPPKPNPITDPESEPKGTQQKSEATQNQIPSQPSMKAQIAAVVEQMRNPDNAKTFGPNEFLWELEANAKSAVSSIQDELTRHSTFLSNDETRTAVRGVLDEVIRALENVRKLI